MRAPGLRESSLDAARLARVPGVPLEMLIGEKAAPGGQARATPKLQQQNVRLWKYWKA